MSITQNFNGPINAQSVGVVYGVATSTSSPKPSRSPSSIVKSIVVRIAGLLVDRDQIKVEKDLQEAIEVLLKKLEPSMFTLSIKLIPICDDMDKTDDAEYEPPLMALVGFKSDKGSLPDFLKACKDEWISVPWIGQRSFDFDGSFVGFTQLYPTQPGKIAADIVALTGLNAHAFGSWRGASGSMWLQDFLPQSKLFPNCRTMIYGYNAKFDTPGTHTLLDFAQDLLEGLSRIRLTKEEQTRPIIFIGHSLGGLVITHCLVEARDRRPELLQATRGLLFFGVPHLGMEIEDFKRSMTEENPRKDLIESIGIQDKLLEDRVKRLKNIIHTFKIPVVSFSEKIQTKQLERNSETGMLSRTGEHSLAVRHDSSSLQLPFDLEHPIPLDKNHSTLVKYGSPYDNDYRKVFKALNDIARAASQVTVPALDTHVTHNEASQSMIGRQSPSTENRSRTTSDFRESAGLYRDEPQESLPDKVLKAQPKIGANTAASPSRELKQFKEKTLIIYHSPDDVRKKLRGPVKILFILTPRHVDESRTLYSPIAWKILDFPHFKTIDSQTLVLYKYFGFALINQDEEGIVQIRSQDLSVIVPWGYRAVLDSSDDVLEWITELKNPANSSEEFIGVFNNTNVPVSLALCMIDNTNPDAPKCFPIAALGELDPDEEIQCPAPSILHAFAVSRHQEGQIVKLSDLKNPVFKQGQPFDILSSELPEKSRHRLYSLSTGKNVLEMAIKR